MIDGEASPPRWRGGGGRRQPSGGGVEPSR